jgi:hypothetical protein
VVRPRITAPDGLPALPDQLERFRLDVLDHLWSRRPGPRPARRAYRGP